MGYLILAVEALAAGWLAIALSAVITGRMRSHWARGFIDVAALLMIAAPFALMTLLASFLYTKFSVPWLWPLIAVDLIFVAGAIVVWVLGRRSVQMATPDAAGLAIEGRSWPMGWLTLSLAIALLLLNSTFASIDGSIRQQLSDVRTEAETLAVSVAPRPIPDRDNAAALYVQLGDYFGRRPEFAIWPKFWDEAVAAAGIDHFRVPLRGDQPVADEVDEADVFNFARADLAAFLSQQAGARQMILEAAARPGCYFGRDYSRPRYDMLLPELLDIRQCCFLLSVDARHRSATGDVRGALENVQAMYGLADHMAADPLIVCVLVGIAIDRWATATLEYLLAVNDVEAADLALIEIDPGVSHSIRMERAMRMEEAATLGVFSDIDQRGPALAVVPADEYVNLGRTALYRVFVLPTDLANYRRFARAASYSPGLSYQELKDRQAAAEELIRSPTGPVTKALTPALGAATLDVVNGEAERRLARVGLAMYRYRAAKGGFPDNLAALAPEFLSIVPRDPFDGQPLKIRKLEHGYVIYSIGPDLVDNGGEPRSQQYPDGDLLFHCLPPAAPAAEKSEDDEKAE